jgi:NADH dehydrogenase
VKVALFGGTGFVGGYLVDALVASGHEPVVLVRPGSEDRLRHPERCRVVVGTVADEDAVRETLAGADGAIYNIGILRERPREGVTFEALHFQGARRCIDHALSERVERFVLMSANGVSAEGTPYQRTKYMAEQYLETSGLAWTVFRPSVIFGDPRGAMELATQLQRDIVRSPLPAPLFYPGLNPFRAGQFRMSPVHVEDVARCFVQALEDPEAQGAVLPLGGPEELTWKEILKRVAAAGGDRLLALPVPALPVQLAAAALDRDPDFPITRDQLRMLLEGNTCDAGDLFARYGIIPTPFSGPALDYLAGDPAAGP